MWTPLKAENVWTIERATGRACAYQVTVGTTVEEVIQASLPHQSARGGVILHRIHITGEGSGLLRAREDGHGRAQLLPGCGDVGGIEGRNDPFITTSPPPILIALRHIEVVLLTILRLTRLRLRNMRLRSFVGR